MDMTLDVTQVLVGFDGEALMDSKPALDDKGKHLVDEHGELRFEKVPITLRPVCLNALTAQLEADRGMTGVKKTEIWVLCGKIYKEDRPLMTSDEITLIKDRIAAAYPPLVVGPAFLLLNGTPAEPPPSLKLAEAEK